MIIKIFLFTTGLISFLYFVSPASFSFVDYKGSDVLGIERRNATFNKPTIDTALLAYCINERIFPENLNNLYEGYLREDKKLDLDKLYNYTIISDKECKYELGS